MRCGGRLSCARPSGRGAHQHHPLSSQMHLQPWQQTQQHMVAARVVVLVAVVTCLRGLRMRLEGGMMRCVHHHQPSSSSHHLARLLSQQVGGLCVYVCLCFVG